MIRAYESAESSSPIITRAVAAGLLGKWSENYEFPAYQRFILEFLSRFPQEISRSVISAFQSFSGLDPSCLDDFSIDYLIEDRLFDYNDLQGQFPVIAFGAGLGGATAYLALSLNAPFLPQSFVITLQKGSYFGITDQYLERTMDAALTIARKDERIMTIQHFDPLHDGWLTKFVNHLRFKLVELPDKYKEFIRTRLKKGGSIIFFNSDASWLRYRLGPRSVFQIGGWGDVTPDEFINGSERLRTFAKINHQRHSCWKLDESLYSLETGPESEWGCEPGLSNQIEKFCIDEGYAYTQINLKHPNDFSRLALMSAKTMIEKDGNEPAGAQVECFSQFDCTSSLQSSLLPLWLIFNTNDSVEYLRSMLPLLPAGKPIFFSPLSTFSITPDIAAWEQWENILGKQFVNIGTRKSHYPSDPFALLHWAEPLRNWVTNNPKPVHSRLNVPELLVLYNDLYR